jgi:flagellar protein FliO/FliZ
VNDGSLVSRIGSVLGLIIGFAIILYLAYIATKFLGKRMTIKSSGNKNIKIIESVSLGQNKSMMIIETAGTVMLIGITANGINLISELDGDNLKSEKSDNAETMDFSKAFKKVLENNFSRKSNKSKEKDNDNSES